MTGTVVKNNALINLALLVVVSSLIKYNLFPIDSDWYILCVGFFFGSYIKWGETLTLLVITLVKENRLAELGSGLIERWVALIMIMMIILAGLLFSYVNKKLEVGNLYFLSGLAIGIISFNWGIGKYLYQEFKIKH
jgi:hypothetical protein